TAPPVISSLSLHDALPIYKGQLGHMIEVISKGGFAGIQPIFSWMGELSDPELLADKLREQDIELAAVALALEWNGTEETPEERRSEEHTSELQSRENLVCR